LLPQQNRYEYLSTRKARPEDPDYNSIGEPDTQIEGHNSYHTFSLNAAGTQDAYNEHYMSFEAK
jgi:hypothetical protein